MDGLIKACKYSWNCEHADHYGFSKILYDFILGKNINQDIIKKLLVFLDTNKFYKKLAEANRIKDIFNIKVVSCYWIGLPELKKETWHNYTTLIPLLIVPMEKIIPKKIDSCLIHPARVEKVKKKELVVKYKPIIKTKNGLDSPVNPKTKTVANNLIKDISEGDFITVHFKSAVEKINQKEVERLSEITSKSLKMFNEEHKKGRK